MVTQQTAIVGDTRRPGYLTSHIPTTHTFLPPQWAELGGIYREGQGRGRGRGEGGMGEGGAGERGT